MTTRRRTEITIETERIIIPTSTSAQPKWCDECQTQVEMMKPEDAAKVLQLATRIIYQLIEAGDLHFLDEAGEIFICRDSLFLQKKPESEKKLLNE